MSFYNHRDSAQAQHPLPIIGRPLPLDLPIIDFGRVLHRQATITSASGTPIRIRLISDSHHLTTFFEGNWGTDDSDKEPHATILALKQSASKYGFDNRFDLARWYCTATHQVWMFGTEYYGNLKITVRGLCSELALKEDAFVHGCALSIDNKGIVLSGMSGAGKTTVLSAIRSLFPGRVQVINDDWGGLSLTTRKLRFTGEHHLHMKYCSTAVLAPNLIISPYTHLSENFNGNPQDPRARALVRPSEVFGVEGLAVSAKLHLFVLAVRDLNIPVSIRKTSPDDIELLEKGQYSSFYDRYEYFMNGSLFLVDADQWVRYRQQMVDLLERYPCFILNNSGTPETAAHLILEKIML